MRRSRAGLGHTLQAKLKGSVLQSLAPKHGPKVVVARSDVQQRTSWYDRPVVGTTLS